MPKARFNRSLGDKEAISLRLVVSMQNLRQTEENLLAFVDLVNRHNEPKIRIDSVEVILSCYLQRHYVGEEKTSDLKANWENKNKQYLTKLNVSFEIIGWKKILDTEVYNDCKTKVDSFYKEDSGFQTVVNNLATQHTSKADYQSAKNYLLEECAVFLTMSDAHVAYPSTELNGAVSYVLTHFKSSLKFHGYMLYDKPEPMPSSSAKEEKTEYFDQSKSKRQKSDKKISKLSNKLVSEMIKHGIFKHEDQLKYFADIIAEFQKSSTCYSESAPKVAEVYTIPKLESKEDTNGKVETIKCKY